MLAIYNVVGNISVGNVVNASWQSCHHTKFLIFLRRGHLGYSLSGYDGVNGSSVPRTNH